MEIEAGGCHLGTVVVFRDRGFTHIGLSTWSGNPRMVRVAEKLGFQREACTRIGCEVEGRFYDRLKFGLLRAEWQVVRNGWPLHQRPA